MHWRGPANDDLDQFNMVSSMVDKSLGSLALVYDTNHSRTMQCQPNCTAPTSTTLYLNDPASGAMEEAQIASGATTFKDYIAGNGSMVAMHTTPGNPSNLFFVSDQLGSITAITDPTRALITGGRQSYDAWGLRRNANGTPASSCNTITSAASRGYTAQEETLSGCLMNLNARIYDPTIGRFLSADPTIPNAANTQSYNRYSYTNNNPLNASDISGLNPDIGVPCMNCWSVFEQFDVNGNPDITSDFFFNAGTVTSSGNQNMGLQFKINGQDAGKCFTVASCQSLISQLVNKYGGNVKFVFPEAGWVSSFSSDGVKVTDLKSGTNAGDSVEVGRVSGFLASWLAADFALIDASQSCRGSQNIVQIHKCRQVVDGTNLKAVCCEITGHADTASVRARNSVAI